MSVLIRLERVSDHDDIRSVSRAAFGGNAESRLVDELRDGGFVCVSLVAELDDKVVGYILFSRISIETAAGKINAIALAPMAVLPEYQRQRIGSKLLSVGLIACRADGHEIVVVLGHPEFYSRFGFSSNLASGLKSPFGGGEAWMALELVPGALKDVAGSVEYSATFGVFT